MSDQSLTSNDLFSSGLLASCFVLLCATWLAGSVRYHPAHDTLMDLVHYIVLAGLVHTYEYVHVHTNIYMYM